MIAIVYPQYYGVGGIARYIESFLSNLPQGHPGVEVITGERLREGVEFPGVVFRHIPVPNTRTGLFRWGVAVRRYLRQAHRAGTLSCVNLHWPPLIPGLFLPDGIPLVVTSHTTYLGMSGRFYGKEYYPSEWGGASVAIKRWMETRTLAKTDLVIALTEQGRAELVASGYRGPVAIHPNGADVVKFCPDQSVEKDVDVLFSGRIETRKGSRSIGEVCRRLVALRPSIRIVVVGYGTDDAAVAEELSTLSGNVTLTGKVPFDRMKSFYDRAKVYVSTSYYEGLPGTCLEAMAMALPAVVWDFGFYDGLVREGETGHRVAPDDHQAMARRVVDLLGRDAVRRTMGSSCRKLLEEEYSWMRLAPQILSTILSVSGGGRE
ncbi:MAG: glycosyltransferase family 4 protein [Fibrobacterota bacterium]|nr:glycosyltransferase family 4 protein [Fibrobacterota bacterium]QQS03786.1 MAG: glycosyltransferase family 4 protein [Fibrobacterota bacterium]